MSRTRDWSSMKDMSVRLLETRTGATLAEWNRRVRDAAPDDEQALLAWLAAQGVTGYAASVLVWERFGYPDFLTASADELIDAQYADRGALRPIFDAIVEAASLLGDVTVQARKGYVSLVTPRRTFARVRATTKTRVDLGLRLPHETSGRLRPSRIHASTPVQLELTRVEDLDDEALRCLERAYTENC